MLLSIIFLEVDYSELLMAHVYSKYRAKLTGYDNYLGY